MVLIRTFTLTLALSISIFSFGKDIHDDPNPIITDLAFTPKDIIELADSLLELSSSEKEIFVTNFDYLINTYVNRDNPYFDPVFIHLVNQYIKTGRVDWLEEDEKNWLIEKSNKIYATVSGNQPPNLLLMDENKSAKFLFQKLDTSIYTILLFWDIDCETCIKTAEEISDLQDLLPLNVFTISASDVTYEWESKTREFPYDNWCHFVDPTNNRDGFKKYNITSTPTFFVVDKSGKLRGKFQYVENNTALFNALNNNTLDNYIKSVATDDDWSLHILIKKLLKHYEIKNETE